MRLIKLLHCKKLRKTCAVWSVKEEFIVLTMMWSLIQIQAL